MRVRIGLKIFSIAVGLLILMGAAALLSLRMTKTVDDQLTILDNNYYPAYIDLARANVRSVEESAYLRRLVIAYGTTPRDPADIAELKTQISAAGKATDGDLALARQSINRQIDDPLDFNDNIALARLDTRVEFLQSDRRDYETMLARLVKAEEAGDTVTARDALDDLDAWRDRFDQRIDAARVEMSRLAHGAISGTHDYQAHVVEISLALLLIAALLGVSVAAAITSGLVRPVRRLLAGTAAVESGALDTMIPVTSSDEIGRLTQSFNRMVSELRVKEQIRDTFGKYVDPRIVAGLIDRPELTDPKGARREMTILFCDMENFTSFSEGMTPVGLVNVMNRYLTVLSEPVRRNSGIIDKYIGDAIMAFWGPPFAAAEDQAPLACFAAIEQLAALPGFQSELPELTGVRRGFPQIAMRAGIATGDVVVGNIGSEQHRNYTVIGDTANIASRLEGANKAYGTRILIGHRTRMLAGEAIEVREIDSVLVVGKSEPEHIYELLGRKGEVAPERLELRDTFIAALADYRERRWEKSAKGFRDCLTIVPGDAASQVFLDRIGRFRDAPPAEDWNGVWALLT
ncbi:MAG TPA: adenylate/guanylate cyclase domain-containing protein, partial [Stellaceae bacterium]|nr:adenylate/guanylate cyclase domain-containing protein [Stellaceae bacterium]